ncbi:MAG: hypothetical protein IKY67_05990 [Paludibacteraceae bacterium]|nr:hypothetical protein [Paludibacteraceae bacterium]
MYRSYDSIGRKYPTEESNVFDLSKVCSVCEYEFDSEDDLFFGVCDNCLEKCENDLEICLKIGALSTEKVEINSCIASILDENEINIILADYLRQCEDVSCKYFIDEDKSWFAEQLVEVLKNEK